MTASTDEDAKAARRKIIHRYARMQTGSRAGIPKFCEPTRDEVTAAAAQGRSAQRRKPIIFDSVDRALECAQALADLDGILMTVYACHRSHSGHAHLSGHDELSG